MWRPPDSESSAHRRRQPRYAGDRVSISAPCRDGFQAPCNEGDGRGARARRHPGHPRGEGLRGPSKHRRPDPRAPRRSGDQHAVRSWGTDRRLLHQDGGRPGRYTLRDNGAGAPRRAAGDRGAPVRRLRTLQTPCAAGVPCRGAQRPGAGTPGRVERGRFVKRARAEVLNARRFGVYHSITVVAPEVAERARPGQFLSIGMPEGRSFIFRRQFSIHEASRRGGWAGTLEFVFDRHGPGTSWLAGVRVHEFLDVIGPLGTAFAYPAKLNACLLVSEGHASAPMYFLAQELRARGKRVDMIVGAETHEHVFKPIEGNWTDERGRPERPGLLPPRPGGLWLLVDGSRRSERRRPASPRWGGDEEHHGRTVERFGGASCGRDGIGIALARRPAESRRRRVPGQGPSTAGSGEGSGDRLDRGNATRRVRAPHHRARSPTGHQADRARGRVSSGPGDAAGPDHGCGRRVNGGRRRRVPARRRVGRSGRDRDAGEPVCPGRDRTGHRVLPQREGDLLAGGSQGQAPRTRGTGRGRSLVIPRPVNPLVVALDTSDVAGAEALARRLGSEVALLKVGLELFTSGGAAAVATVR